MLRMTYQQSTNRRRTRQNSRYTPPRPTAEMYSYSDYRACLTRSVFSEPELMVINHPAKPTPRDVSGVLTLFMGGENLNVVDRTLVLDQSGVKLTRDIVAAFPTSIGLAHILYIGEVNGVVITTGHRSVQEIEDLVLDPRDFLEDVLVRKGDSRWFQSVSRSDAMCEALDIARLAGFQLPANIDMDEWTTELIRRRWEFGQDTSFPEAVRQAMRDAGKIRSRP